MFNYKNSPFSLTRGLRVVLLVVASVALAVCMAADVNKAIADRDKAVSEADAKLVKVLQGELKKAKDSEKVSLYRLINKYDPKNEEANKFLAALGEAPVDKADLLGEPVTAIPFALAQKVEKGYKADKVTAKDWDSFPSIELKVEAKKMLTSNIKVNKDEVYIVLPHPEDKWQLTADGAPVLWKGVGNGFMNMIGKVLAEDGLLAEEFKLDESVLMKITKEGKLAFQPATGGYAGLGLGSVRVKICKVEK